MNFLPIAIRELQVSARRPMTYYLRSLSALYAACITLGFLVAGFAGALTAASAGAATFWILSGMSYGVAISGALITADCISQERREGTLGFLFLTDLRGHDIVLGKLARLGALVYWLAAAFPALGFTILLGGVSLGDFAGVAVALLNTLFFFAALGLLISACSWNGRAAVSAAMAGVLICSGPMLAAVAGLKFSGAAMALFLPTPAGAFLAALAPQLGAVAKPNYLASLVVSHAVGWLFIAAASFMAARSFYPKEAARIPTAAPQRLAGGSNPALALDWGDGRPESWGDILWLVAVVCVICVAAVLIHPVSWFDTPTFVAIVLALHLLLKFQAANGACRSMPERRQSGELEILLTTPLDGDAIVSGSIIALKRRLLRPFLFVMAVDGFVLIAGWWKLGLWEGFGWAGALLFEFVWFIGNLYSLTWLGLLMGLKSTSHTKALGGTLFCILMLPWSALAVAAACVGVTTMGRSLARQMSPVIVLEFLVALSVCNLGFAGWAVSELRDRFRFLAASQPLPPERHSPSWSWRSIAGKLRPAHWKRTPQAAQS